jgi:hypothetical protein
MANGLAWQQSAVRCAWRTWRSTSGAPCTAEVGLQGGLGR